MNCSGVCTRASDVGRGGLRVRSTSRVEKTRPEFREGMFEHGEASTDDSGIGFNRSPDGRG